jgi:type I restriction enzyme, R subunit
MSFNESIVEEAALEWFGELGYAVGHGPHLASIEPVAERRGKRFESSGSSVGFAK